MRAAEIISDDDKPLIVAKRRPYGVYLQAGNAKMILSDAELSRLVEFVRTRPPAMTAATALGQLARYHHPHHPRLNLPNSRKIC